MAQSRRCARRRADLLLVERGLFESRAKAQAAIAAGLVTVDGTPVAQGFGAGPAEAEITAEAPHPWVSRGGVKLAAALDAFAIDPAGRICLDLGASTGGFTEVLLSRGARAGLCGRCRPRPAASEARRRSARRRASKHGRPPPRPRRSSPSRSTFSSSSELHLAQARAAAGRAAARARRGARRAGQAAVRGRAGACRRRASCATRPCSAAVCDDIARLRRLARLHRSSASIPSPISAATAIASS